MEKIENFIEKKIHWDSDVTYDLYEIINDMNVIANDSFLLKQFGIYLKEMNYVITTDSVETIEEFYDMNYKTGSLKLKDLKEAFDSDEEQFVQCSRICNNLYSNDDIEECFSILFKSLELICERVDDNQEDHALKEKIENYINDNFNNPSLSLEMLSECTGVAYYHLSRVFKELFGTNFIKYLTLYRLEKAKELLKNTKKTMEQIAVEIGFLSGDSFAKAFKKYCGMPPGQYRKTE